MNTPTNMLEIRARRSFDWFLSDDGAKWAFRGMLVLTAGVLFVVGRHQWFTRDDWGYVITRQTVLDQQGWQNWLFDAQDGHWLAIPIVIFHVTKELFALDSYWPFLIPTMLAHVGAVLLTRVLCRRLHVSAWTTTLVCSMLLVFGAGWDNIVFAIQICYNLSLVCFLAQVLLADHEGPADRRDYIGAGLGVVSVMTSGFGPIFMVGVLVLLLLRRRWKALAIAIAPQAVLYGWWLVTWASDPVSDAVPGDRVQLPAYLARGVTATFESMVAVPALAGIAIIATLAVAFWSGIAWRGRSVVIALWSTVVIMFLAIGFERIGFGVATAASSRYLHVAAIVIAPAFALAVDQLRRVADEVRWAARLLLAAAIAINAGALRTSASKWALDARAEQDLYEVIVGSGAILSADPFIVPSASSPNVTVGWLPSLVTWGAIVPRAPADEDERLRMLEALGTAP